MAGNFTYNPNIGNRHTNFIKKGFLSDGSELNETSFNEINNNNKFNSRKQSIIKIENNLVDDFSELEKTSKKLNQAFAKVTLSWIVVASSLLAVSIIGYITPRQQTGYMCYPCPSNYDYDSKNNICQPKLTTTTTTTTTTATTTTTTTEVCSLMRHYDTTAKMCVDNFLFNENCESTSQCRTDLGLDCLPSTCQCANSDQFWNNSRCVDYSSYNEACIDDNECKGLLVCKKSGWSCSCPSSISNNKCDCPPRTVGNEYYWNSNDCVLAASYGESCKANADYTCKKLEENTICDSDGVCTCDSNAVWKSNKCVKCASNWVYYRGLCFRESQEDFTGKTTDIQSDCYNEPTSKLAQLFDYDITNDFFQTFLFDSRYYFDAFRISSSNTFTSLDNTVNLTYNPTTWCYPVKGPYAIYRPSRNCFDSNSLNGDKFICQYEPY